jgi:serine/threonine protein kinase
LCINPDVILVRFDKQGNPRPILLDLGVADPGNSIYELWNENYNLAAYTAPEIADGRSGVSPASDVYGLGTLLYEMLAGHPPYEYHLKKDPAVLKNVMEGEFKTTGRIDLKNIPEIAEKAINRQNNQRFQDVPAFVAALQPNFPPIPAERRSFQINWRILFIVLGALLAISLLLVLALSIVPG